VSTETEPRWRRLEPDQRRAQILACARRLFGERNYESVSTTELARESGVARGLINHYFGTKRELYLEVVRQLVFIPDLAVERLAHGTLEQRVAGSVDRFLDVIERNRSMWLVMLGAGGYGRDEDLARILREADENIADRMLETLGLKGIPAGREALRAMIRSYSALAKSVTGEWMVRGTLTREQARTLLTTTLIAIVRDAHGRLFGRTG
jgi:AcrR family transcriptional regulator